MGVGGVEALEFGASECLSRGPSKVRGVERHPS